MTLSVVNNKANKEFHIRAKGTIIVVFQNHIRVLLAELIEAKTCCNKKLKYLSEFIIVNTSIKIIKAIDITDQYGIDESTARIIREWNHSSYLEGYSIIRQADVVDLTVDNDNVDLIQSLESIKNLRLCIKMPKISQQQEIEESKITEIDLLNQEYGRTKDPYILNKYTDMLVVLCYTCKQYKAVKIEVAYQREEHKKKIESKKEIFYLTRLLEDLSELQVVSLNLKLDLQKIFRKVSNFVFNSRHLNKLTLYHQGDASTFDNLQTRGTDIAKYAIIKLGSEDWLVAMPIHVWNEIHFCEDKDEALDGEFIY